MSRHGDWRATETREAFAHTGLCTLCPLRRTCREICDPVEAILPSMEEGRVDWGDLPRLYEGRILRHALLDHLDLLTRRQRQVVVLYYRENLQQTEIAHLLEISQQAVADSLRRARHRVGLELRETD